MKTEIIIRILIVGFLFVVLYLWISKSSNIQSKMKSEKKRADLSNSIFYHEDDYRQVEILPFENFNELIKQAENVQDFAEKNFDGVGYSDIMIREENGFKLKQRGIKWRALDQLLSELPVKKYTEVSTGIRPGEMKRKNTFGYGENYNGIFFNFEADEVKEIWIVGFPKVEKTKLAQTLSIIGSKWNLLLMDWNSLELIDLKDKDQIEKYLK